jgi:uncharacterized protein (DUF1499 family)
MNMTALPVISLTFSIFIAACSGVRPTDLGLKEGKLAPCPASPNCVSSQSLDREHAAAPLTFTGSSFEAREDLKKVIRSMVRARIITEGDFYLHVEFRSALWRFVDDVEFYLDDAGKTIHIRSASRLGRYDFGANRKRVETIRARWNALQG